ncbi:PIN domain-like protein, partial [Schizopora paradoxa]
MGVKDLWEYLQPAGQSRAFKNLVVSEGFESNVSRRRGYRLGIDCSLWYQQVARAGGNDKGENPLLRGLFFKIIALAQLPIIPLFVFDGRNRPKEKRGRHMGKSGSHPLNKKMREFLEAFGMEWRMAHGEAEAELAVLNQTGVIDAILSDDADTFVFGAKVVIRNLGSELSGNKSNPALDLNQNKSSYHCMIYRADEIERNPRVRLTRGGMILFALLNGGDYDKGALGIGKVSARGLARCGFGDTLLEAYNNRNEESFHHFLRGWREDVNQELRTNSRGLLQSARPGMQLPPNFPDIELLELYTNPATSQSAGTTGGGQLKDNKQINLAKIASLCEELFEWGTRSAIVKRFRSLKLWDAAIITILRQVALEEDRKEVDRRIAAGSQDIHLRGVVRPPGQDSVPLDASLIRKYLDKNTEDHLAQAFVNRGPQSQVAEEDRIPLLKIVKKEKEHVKTDFMPEYKIEVDPEDFVQLTLSGIKGRRPESFVITGDETDESEDGEAQTTGNRKKSKKKQPDPLDPYSMNCPASILVIVDPKSVQLFEQGINDKERKKEDAENAK